MNNSETMLRTPTFCNQDTVFSLTVIHYGSRAYNPDCMKPIKNEWVKPTGRPWTSPTDSEWGWKP